MIQVYLGTDTDIEKNGRAILHPESCTVTEEAGGSYELALTHAVDEHGLWKYLQPGNLIKCPVPVATTEQIVSGDSVQVWKVTASSTPLRATPQSPSRIRYAEYVSPEISGVYYSKGAKVTDPWDDNNYQCNTTPVGDAADYFPSRSPLWTRISNTTGGGTVLQTLKRNTEFYLSQVVNSTWIRVTTYDGVEGYILDADAKYVRTIRVEPVAPRTVRDQLFRVYDVTVNTKTHRVSVSARHVSYDLAGVLTGECSIIRQAPSIALSLIKNALMVEQTSTIATNLSADDDGTYTGTHSYQNGIAALLDPDSGFVPHYKARLFRDNWDIFIYRNTERNRGLKLSYGTNLKGVTWSRNSDKLINRVMPVAQKSDGSELFLSEIYVDSPILDSYPVIRMERLSVDGKVGGDDGEGGTWTTTTLRNYMKEMANRRFSVDNCDKPAVEIKVEFQLLGETAEYAQYKDLQKLYLYDTVTVYDPTVELEQSLQVSKTVWDAIRERYTGITLGDVFDYTARTIAGYELRNGAINYRKLSAEAIAKLKG